MPVKTQIFFKTFRVTVSNLDINRSEYVTNNKCKKLVDPVDKNIWSSINFNLLFYLLTTK